MAIQSGDSAGVVLPRDTARVAPSGGALALSDLALGVADAAAFRGIPPGLLNPAQAPPPGALAMLEPLVRRAAMTTAINEAWADYNKAVPRAKGEAEQAVRPAG